MLKFNPKRVSLELTGEKKPHTCFWGFFGNISGKNYPVLSD